PGAIEAELMRYLPFLATTKIMITMLDGGLGREQAHALLREHSLASSDGLDLLDRLAGDARVPLDRSQLEAAIADRDALVGNAPAQVADVVERVAVIAARHPHAAHFDPGEIL